MTGAAELNADDPRFVELARQLLHRYEENAHEDNIRSAVREFLVGTALTAPYKVQSEANPDPSRVTRRRVDLVLQDAFVEVKRRIGTAANPSTPSTDHVTQLDEYLELSPDVSVGLLTDGRHWLRRTKGQDEIQTKAPWSHVLKRPEDGAELFRWLNEFIFSGQRAKPVSIETIESEFGPSHPVYATHIELIRRLFDKYGQDRTVAIKFDLWQELLSVALGEIVSAGASDSLHNLFIRHTYLVTMINIITQASYGMEIEFIASTDPVDLLVGKRFASDTGLAGVIESDFFAWLVEVDGGTEVAQEMAAWVASFDWSRTGLGLASALYQVVIPAPERKQLGEYYTPDWLADAIVQEAVEDPLSQRVLDPACGSGSFLVAAIKHLLDAAVAAKLPPKDVLDVLRRNVVGIDVHPVAVHLARSEWAIAARVAIIAAVERRDITPPVYLGDSLQLMSASEGMLGQVEVSVPITGDPLRRELRFPRSLINEPELFDTAMEEVAAQVRFGGDLQRALLDSGIPEEERVALEPALALLTELHEEGRDHIWSYYTRNVVRPLVLAEEGVDVVIGNPPWIAFNKTAAQLSVHLKRLSVRYQIWAGAQFASHADMSALFFTRCTDLYLDVGGVCAMVMPHNALKEASQYQKWQSGAWRNGTDDISVDLGFRPPWDLEPLDPNSFFPVPACVVFGQRRRTAGELPTEVERWEGKAGTAGMARTAASRPRLRGFLSPYADVVRNGANIYPLPLFFVEEDLHPGPITAPESVRISPHRGLLGREPWRSLDLMPLTQQTVERRYVFEIALSRSIAPFHVLKTYQALLPLCEGPSIERSEEDNSQVNLDSIQPRMRSRWVTVSDIWRELNQSELIDSLDHHGKLSTQLDWRRQLDGSDCLRVVYGASGHPTAAILESPEVLVEHGLWWTPVASVREGRFLCGILNSLHLRELIAPLMTQGQFGPRHVDKIPWKMHIPLFDEDAASHCELADVSSEASLGVRQALEAESVRRQVGTLSTTLARRVARDWLAESKEGAAVEAAVRRVMGAA